MRLEHIHIWRTVFPAFVFLCFVFTDDEDSRAGSDACDHIGGDTLPFSVVFLAEGDKL